MTVNKMNNTVLKNCARNSTFLNFIISYALFCSQNRIFAESKHPNFVFILTDDLDITLGGMTPLVKTQSILKKYGVEFTNAFVTTPLCCPSRASILTGKYAHNHGVRNNSLSGNCNSIQWQKDEEKNSFITHFEENGYETFYAGKYLNKYGSESVGGVKHIPPGWKNWVGLVGNSRYYNYSLSVNGNRVTYGDDPKKDYLTNVMMDYAEDFLNKQNESSPFFMFLSFPAPHDPFTPTPPNKNTFCNLTAPRTPNFNVHGGKSKHWLLRQAPSPLPPSVIESIDEVFRNRWRTLLSVDQGVHKIYSQLKSKNLLDNTYIIFTSDNGFHLGQFSLPWDKRQPYEFDVRVPLLVRGPGVKTGIKIKHPVLNIDLAPTLLDLANISISKEFDGESFAPYLIESEGQLSKRSSFIIEHQGEFSSGRIKGCPQYPPQEVNICEIDCICEDSWNNTYTCVRQLSDDLNLISCIFKDNENFREAYNLTEDPYQLQNVFFSPENANVVPGHFKTSFIH